MNIQKARSLFAGDGVRIRRWFRIRELPWIGLRLLSKSIVSAVPIRAHLSIAKTYGLVYRRVLGVPIHVIQNMRSTVIGQDLEPSVIESTARRSVEFYASRYVMRILANLPGFNDPRRWTVRGLEHLDTALELNRGVMLITAHFGYARLIPAILRTHGYDAVQVSSSQDDLERNREREQWLAAGSELRRRVFHATQVFGTDPGRIQATLDVRPIFSALDRGRAVVVAGDGMRAASFAKVVLIGRSYPLPTGFMKIAMMTKAPLLPVFALEGDRRNPIVVEIKPPLQPDPAAPASENLQLFASVLDEQLKSSPHLWHRWAAKNLFDRLLAWSESNLRDRYTGKWHKAIHEEVEREGSLESPQYSERNSAPTTP